MRKVAEDVARDRDASSKMATPPLFYPESGFNHIAMTKYTRCLLATTYLVSFVREPNLETNNNNKHKSITTSYTYTNLANLSYNPFELYYSVSGIRPYNRTRN
jgi:hypothetical protein